VAVRVHREAGQEDLPLGAIIGRCLLVECSRDLLPNPFPSSMACNLEAARGLPRANSVQRATILLLHQPRGGPAVTAAGRVCVEEGLRESIWKAAHK
jgi:hypothetical protein